MGINGLLRNTKSVGQKKHISDYRNKTVAVDGYSWMHKAMFKCALDIYTDKNIDGIVQYFAKRISYFLKLKIKVILVFDGDDLPLKQMTNSKRKGNRQQKLKEAQEHLQNNDLDQARKLLAMSLDVTPDMVYTLKQNLLEQYPQQVKFIVAPYEADSQLAYLSKIDYIDLVISEDSDLLVFGAKEVFYKMDKHFYGVSYKLLDLKYCEEMNLSNWTFDKFIQMCILSGCDYLNSPKGIGLKKAYQLFNKYNNIDKIIDSINNNLEDSYYNKFIYAYLAFKYSRVYCPKDKKIVPLNPQDTKEINLKNSFDLFATQKAKKNLGNFDFLGIDNGALISSQIADCKIHPVSKKQFQSIYKSKNSKSKSQGNYYKRKLSQKLKQTITLFKANKKQPEKIYIKEVIKNDYYSQQIKVSTSSSQQKNSIIQNKTKANTQNDGTIQNDYIAKIQSKKKLLYEKNQQKINQKSSSQASIDYDKFLKEFLQENKKLKIDCQKILNIFDKSSKLQKINQQILLLFK